MRVARSGLDADTQPRAETVFMLDRYPEITNLTIDTGPFSYGRSNQDPMERFFLACGVRKRDSGAGHRSHHPVPHLPSS